jgi:CrcB protein
LLWLGIGFCGCLTTFSSWMLDVVHLLEAQQPWQGLVLVLATLSLGLAASLLGLLSSRMVFRARRDG